MNHRERETDRVVFAIRFVAIRFHRTVGLFPLDFFDIPTNENNARVLIDGLTKRAFNYFQ